MKTISLLVTPKEASILMLAGQMGVVNLVMRSPNAEEPSENPEARPGELFGEMAPIPKDKNKDEPPPKAKETPVPVVVPPPVEKAKPRPTWTIRVLKPNAVEEVKFEREPSGDNPATSEWKLSAPAGSASDAQPAAKEPSGAKPPPAATDLGALVPRDFQPLVPPKE